VISISGAVQVVVYLIVAGLIFGLLFWLVGYCGLPQPFDKVARVILAVLAVLVCIGILLSLAGAGQGVFRP
jgi:predicted tellurium resistance membrane protein TerC